MRNLLIYINSTEDFALCAVQLMNLRNVLQK